MADDRSMLGTVANSKLTTRGILKAERSPFLNPARNGTTMSRHRKRRPLRLPPDLWNRIDQVAKELALAFPSEFISSNSTIEFLIQEGLTGITGEDSGVLSVEALPQND